MNSEQQLQHFCTLFNSAYLSRGLALYRSLVKHSPHFHLYVFAFDEACFDILTALQLSHMTVIPLSALESHTPALEAVKPDRTLGEYCWTCTPSTIRYCLDVLDLPSVCYCDADIYFWRDPAELLAEVKEGSVLLTEHRYTPTYDKTREAGKYCVQFMWFKRNDSGMKALQWWQQACIEWCYDRIEPGRFGDQKYLDDWTTRFEGVVVLQQLGGGVAPWNIQQYTVVAQSGSGLVLKELTTSVTFDLVFYHFHALRFVNHQILLGGYQLTPSVIESIYKPYVAMLKSIEQDLFMAPDCVIPIQTVNLHGRVIRPVTLRSRLQRLKQQLLGQYHCLDVE